MMLLESTAVHIPLLDQCCFFNVSASCLWVGFFLNLTGQTFLSLTPPPPYSSSLPPLIQSLTDFFCEELFLNFSEVIFSVIPLQMYQKVGGKGRKCPG